MGAFIRDMDAREKFLKKYKIRSKFRKLRDDNRRLFKENSANRKYLIAIKKDLDLLKKQNARGNLSKAFNIKTSQELKERLAQQGTSITIDALTKEHEGRLCFDLGITKFEAFLIKSPNKSKRLYIFLTAAAGPNPYPMFQRVTWEEYLDGMCLYIDDPTRHEKQYGPAFFYGDNEHNYLDLIGDIVNSFKSLYTLENSDLCFLGHSNSGTAALYLTRNFKGCSCLAFNPRIDVERQWRGNIKFNEMMKIDWNSPKIKPRIKFYDIAEDNKSSICIYMNIRSPSDKDQTEAFFDYHKTSYKTGLQRLRSVWFVIAEIEADFEHAVMPDILFSKLLERFMLDGKGVTNDKVELANLCLYYMREVYKFSVIA